MWVIIFCDGLITSEITEIYQLIKVINKILKLIYIHTFKSFYYEIKVYGKNGLIIPKFNKQKNKTRSSNNQSTI